MTVVETGIGYSVFRLILSSSIKTADKTSASKKNSASETEAGVGKRFGA